MVELPKYCPIYLQKILTGMLLFVVLFIAFWIRIQGVERIPDGQFTGVDPYLYRWQALTVSDKDYLPARDMHRWYPSVETTGSCFLFFLTRLRIPIKR